jgi:hypothetical protein
MEYMVPPIGMCVSGHNICTTCKPKVPHCPTCRQQFSDGRNLALEALARDVKYPCRNGQYGCEEMLAYDKIGDHQQKCQYSPQGCPVTELGSRSCSWTGNYRDMKGHMKQKHGDLCWNYVEGGMKFLTRFTAPKEYWRFVFAYNEVFCCTFRVKDDTVYAVLLHIGLPENAAKYKYKVEFFKEDKTSSITVMHVARSVAENLDDIFKSGNCVKLHCDVVRCFENEEGDVDFTVGILRVGN